MTKLPLLLFLMLLMPPQSFAWNEPDGFRGIRWATDISELDQGWTEIAEHADGVKFYTRSGDLLKIGEAEIRAPGYGFYKGKFFAAHIAFDSVTNFQKIKETLFTA